MPASSGPRDHLRCRSSSLILQRELNVTGIRFPSGLGHRHQAGVERGQLQRLIRKAIQYAIENDRVSVTLVHKGNIMKFTERRLP